jgi:hypothetical protein
MVNARNVDIDDRLLRPRIPRVKGVAMSNDMMPAEDEENSVLELLDRLLNAGVVLCGDVVVSVADIELLYLRLQLTLSSVETARRAGWFVPTVSACHLQLEEHNV